MVDQKAIYTFTKCGVFYFSRRVPKSLLDRFDKPRVVTCLHAGSLPQARKAASALSAQLEVVWAQMRLEKLLRWKPAASLSPVMTAITRAAPLIRLLDAGALYRRLNGCRPGFFRIYFAAGRRPAVGRHSFEGNRQPGRRLGFRIASPDQEAFEGVTENVDNRVLGALRAFFKTLDDAGATVRLVENEREFTLRRDEISLARERTENATLEERTVQMTGTFYLLPAAPRFELRPNSEAEPVKGSNSIDCLASLTGGSREVRPGIIGTERTVHLRAREIQARGQEPKRSDTLLSVLEPHIEGRF